MNKYASRLTLTGLHAPTHKPNRATDNEIAELIRATSRPRSLTAEILGDPLPGRSALDKQRMNLAAKLVPDTEGAG
jgi:hypothetical protein